MPRFEVGTPVLYIPQPGVDFGLSDKVPVFGFVVDETKSDPPAIRLALITPKGIFAVAALPGDRSDLKPGTFLIAGDGPVPTSSTRTTDGKAAFEAYNKALASTSDGRETDWERLDEHYRRAWEAAAMAGAESVTHP